MQEPIYELAWPRELFEWEARQILALPFAEARMAVVPLVAEAYEDDAVRARAEVETGQVWVMDPSVIPVPPAQWLTDLLADESRLKQHVAPLYWAERNGEVNSTRPPGSLAEGFIRILFELQDRGYFPRALPRDCTDDPTDYAEVAGLVERATKLRMQWPPASQQLGEVAAYSLMEYFHDEAQRPRTYSIHKFNDCGPHYDHYSRESGGVVYRWRVNTLLAEHGVDLRLANTGAEKGRLVRHFSSPLDELADSQVEERAEDKVDEVAHAIRDFRQRGATLPQKRAALALLAGALEPRRKAIGASLTKQDESDLFLIANKYAIRHRDVGQHTDYGDEFLDWIFWNYLSTVQLMEALERR